jgi:hypothetical protein
MKELRDVIRLLESDPTRPVDRTELLDALRTIETEVAALRTAAFILFRYARVSGAQIEDSLASVNADNDAIRAKIYEIAHGLEGPIKSEGIRPEDLNASNDD